MQPQCWENAVSLKQPAVKPALLSSEKEGFSQTCFEQKMGNAVTA